MYKRVSFLLFILISLGQVSGQPDWVNKRPSDPNSYIGISFVEINNRSPAKYAEEADNQALLEISKQIQVQVIGKSRSIFEQEGLDIEQSFSEENLFYTVGNIKELTKVDDYLKDNEYWVYWEVPKAAYAKAKKEAVKAARNQFVKYINTNNVDITQRFRHLITALDALSQYPGSDFDLHNQVKNELNKMVDRLKLEPINQNVSGTFDRRIDQPLEVLVSSYIEEYEGFTDMDLVEAQVYNLPVQFQFIKGSGNFTFPVTRTDATGRVITQITRITDSQPHQEIIIKPNLVQLKPNSKSFPLLDRELKSLSNTNNTVIVIDVLKERRLEIAIYVGSAEGFNNLEVSHLNDTFEKMFNDKTQWIIRSREDAEKEIRNQGYDPLDACTSRECRIAIVNVLKIEELILISMNYDPQKRIVTCTMKLEDVKKDFTDTILIKTIELPHDILFVPEFLSKNYMADWVEEFIHKTNPGRIEIQPLPGQQISMFVDNDRENIYKLPYYENLVAGTYNMTFFLNGYEQKDTTILISQGEPFKATIALRKKSRFKAFALSVIPGQGQRYSSDVANPGRRKSGFYYSLGGALAVLATGYAWYQYDNSFSNYHSIKGSYALKTNMPDIELYRQKTINANQQMFNHYNIAVSISAATIGFWIYNMVEATINFPKTE